MIQQRTDWGLNMKKTTKSKNKKEKLNNTENSLEEMRKAFIEQEIESLKNMTEEELREQGEMEEIKNYQSMSKSKLLDALINNAIEVVNNCSEDILFDEAK